MTYKKERGMGMELKIPENFFVGSSNVRSSDRRQLIKQEAVWKVSGIPGQIFQFLISTIKWEAM